MALQGKVAVVTGGSRGIGKEICLSLAREGASVVVAYQGNVEAANRVVSEITATLLEGAKASIAVKADVAVSADVTNLFAKAEEQFGRLDIVVHMAGILLTNYPKIEDTTEEEWDRVFATNTKGTFLVCKEALKRLGAGGRIITTSTTTVSTMIPNYGAYTSSKAAVESFTKILAKEVAGRGITVNCVAPGATATDMFLTGKSDEWVANFVKENPTGRLGEPKDIAAIVKFIVSPEAEWVNGQVIRVNGGVA